MFMTGTVAMYNSGIWDTPLFREIESFDWDVAMFPKGPTGIRAFGTGGSAYCILKSTEHPDTAWEVVKALAADKGQIMMAEKGLAQPANKKIAEGPHWTGSPKKPLHKDMLDEAVKYAIYSPFDSNWREAEEKYIVQNLDYLLLGDKTGKEFAESITPPINKLLQQED
jgi:multiple sugar transport system substrate-binding protein